MRCLWSPLGGAHFPQRAVLWAVRGDGTDAARLGLGVYSARRVHFSSLLACFLLTDWTDSCSVWPQVFSFLPWSSPAPWG